MDRDTLLQALRDEYDAPLEDLFDAIDDVPLEIREGTQAVATLPVAMAQVPAAPVRVAASASPSAGGSLADAERERILSALAECRNNKTKAAEVLGISRRTLHRKLKEWGMQ